MLIRHAEKPDKDQGSRGVTSEGEHDEHSLSVRGWTRAGALAALFAHVPTASHVGLTTPRRILATMPSHSAHSHREVDTATPIAERLGLKVELPHGRADVAALAADLLASDDDALVVWHHGALPGVFKHLPLTSDTTAPSTWPDDRFDLVWLLTREADGYSFAVVEQGLLAGDAAP